MTSPFRFRWYPAVAGLIGMLVSTGCAMMAPTSESYVPPPLGSTWTTVYVSTGSYGSGSRSVDSKRGERMWNGSPVVTFESTAGTVISDAKGQWIGFYVGDKPMLLWDPPLGYQWPFQVGKTWTTSHRATNNFINKVVSFDLTVRVEAYEDVKVPAGTFKTFRIKSVDTVGNENTQWFSQELGIFVKQSLKRGANNPSGVGTQEAELTAQNIRK